MRLYWIEVLPCHSLSKSISGRWWYKKLSYFEFLNTLLSYAMDKFNTLNIEERLGDMPISAFFIGYPILVLIECSINLW